MELVKQCARIKYASRSVAFVLKTCVKLVMPIQLVLYLIICIPYMGIL